MNSGVVGRKKSLPKLYALFAIVAMLSIGIVAVAGNESASDADPLNPIQIDDAAELRLIGNDVGYPLNEDYILANNIDFTSEALFTPIGSPAEPFVGTFNGNGYAIIGITISTTDWNAALFGYVSGNAKIVNVTMAGGTITTETPRYPSSESIAGGIVAEIFGTGNVTISNCVNNAVVTSTTYTAGGIVGIVREPVTSLEVAITECVNNGHVRAFNLAGGILGKSYGGKVNIAACLNTGMISGVESAEPTYKLSLGGIMGWGGAFTNVLACVNTGAVLGDNIIGYGYSGGIAGIAYGTIIGAANSGNVVSKTIDPALPYTPKANGPTIPARAYDTTEDPVFDLTARYDAVYKARAGGIVGYMGAGTIEGSTDVAANGGAVYAKGLDARAGGIVGYTLGSIIGTLNVGNVDAVGWNATSFTYAGGITGYAKANIAGAVNMSYVSAVDGINNRAGGIAGYLVASFTIAGAISHCDVTASGTANEGHSYAGGIAGISYGNITLCGTTTYLDRGKDVFAAGYYARAGGIAGIVEPSGVILGCVNDSNVRARSSGYEAAAGGIAGYVNGKSGVLLSLVQDAVNTGSVLAESNGVARSVAGGIVGKVTEYALINECFVRTDKADLIIWAESSRASLAGGIAGIANGNVTLSSDSGTARISPLNPATTVCVISHAPTAYVGGIAGMTGNISYIYGCSISYADILCEYVTKAYCSVFVGNSTGAVDACISGSKVTVDAYIAF